MFHPLKFPSLMTQLCSQLQEQLYKNALRIKLDVSIVAPEIVVPLHSDSDEVIVADLGMLTLSNTFHTVPAEKRAMGEEHNVKLSNLQVTR